MRDLPSVNPTTPSYSSNPRSVLTRERMGVLMRASNALKGLELSAKQAITPLLEEVISLHHFAYDAVKYLEIVVDLAGRAEGASDLVNDAELERRFNTFRESAIAVLEGRCPA